MEKIMEKVKLVKVDKFLGTFKLTPALKVGALGQAFAWFLYAIFISAFCSGKGKRFKYFVRNKLTIKILRFTRLELAVDTLFSDNFYIRDAFQNKTTLYSLTL